MFLFHVRLASPRVRFLKLGLIDEHGEEMDRQRGEATSAVERAATTVQNLRWFEIVDSRGSIEDGRVSEWQVTIKIGFTLND